MTAKAPASWYIPDYPSHKRAATESPSLSDFFFGATHEEIGISQMAGERASEAQAEHQ